MELLTIYNQYQEVSKELTSWLEGYLEESVVALELEVGAQLEEKRQQLESYLEQANQLEDEAHEQDIKDLCYLLTDTLFLTIDLLQMVQYQDIGRFKMRVMNYIGKRRRAEVFGQ